MSLYSLWTLNHLKENIIGHRHILLENFQNILRLHFIPLNVSILLTCHIFGYVADAI